METEPSSRRRAAQAQVHIPIDRRHALARGAELPDTASGAALFADISGFTRLTGDFTRDTGRRRGPEALTDTINPVYDRLVEQVHAWGGSVTSFAGDAITCWFDERLPEPSTGAAAHRAVTCAEAMQAVMADFSGMRTAWGAPVSLGIKISVVAGTARRFLVGDPAHMLHDVLAGRLLTRMAAANALAGTGEIVVGQEVAAALGDALTQGEARAAGDGSSGETFRVAAGLERRAEPAPWPELPGALDEASVRPWLLGPVFERLRTGYDLQGELRLAIPVFVQFGGIDYDGDAAAGAALDAYVRWVQGVLSRYDGFLLQVTVGDKGSLALGCFGAPLSREDDPNRAIAAALELVAPPPELAFAAGARIGLFQGLLWAGAYGARDRRCYGVLGDPVNLAARQMAMAEPGGILVSQRLTQLGAALYRFQDVAQIVVKGRSEPLLVSAVVGRRTAVRRPAAAEADNAMVGRAAEMARLKARLEALADGEGGVVIVEGEAGIGKSRLIAEFLDQADQVGVAHMLTAGDAIETTTPYHAWQPIVRQALHLGSTVRAEADTRRVLTRLARLDEDRSELAPLLSSLVGFEMADTPDTEHLEPRAKAEARHALVVELLSDEMRGEPLLLVVDDAHWLDPSSWALLADVEETLDGVLVVIGTRPMTASQSGVDETPELLRRLAESEGTERIDLGRMSPQETMALVAHRLSCDRLPEAIADLIVERGEGNPFFSEELGRALRDRGIIRIENGACSIAADAGDLRGLDLPDSIQGVITQRIDLLDSEEQLTVRVASVVGRIFERDTIADIYPEREGALRGEDPLQTVIERYLNTLETLDITPLESPDRPERYMFKHALTQDVAYGLMTFAQRRSLHRAMAEWYEAHHADNLSPYLAILAHHWERAEDSDRAIHYLSSAGAQALDTFANVEALSFVERAMALADGRSEVLGAVARPVTVSGLQRGRWEQQLGEAHFRLGHLTDSERHLRRALDHLGWPIPAESAGLAIDIGAVLAAENWRRVMTASRDSEGDGKHADEGGVATSSRAREGGSGAGEGRVATESGVGTEAESDAALERTRLAYRIYDHLAEVAFLNGDQALTLYATFKSLELAEALGPSPELAQAYAKVSFTLSFVPLHDAAQQYKSLAMEVIAPFEDPVALANVTLLLGVYAASIGDWDETERLMAMAGASFERIGNWQRWGFCAQIQLRAAQHQGRFDDFGRLADRLHEAGLRHKNVEQQVWGLRDKGHHRLLTGDDAREAVRLLDEAIALGERVVEKAAEVMSLGLLACAHVRAGDTAAARRAAERALEMAEAPTSFGQFTSFAATAEAFLDLWEGGDRDDAELAAAADRATAALEAFAEVFPIGKPRALLLRGRCHALAGDGERASGCWLASVEEAEGQSADYDAALALLALGGRAGAEAGAEAGEGTGAARGAGADENEDMDKAVRVERLDRAGAIFDRLGAGHEKALAAEARAGIGVQAQAQAQAEAGAS